MVDQGVPDGAVLPLQQSSRDTEFPSPRLARYWAPAMGEGVANRSAGRPPLAARCPGGNVPRPADEEGDAVASLQMSRLPAAVKIAGVVPSRDELGKVGHRRAAIVAGEDEDGVVGNALLLQLGREPATKSSTWRIKSA